MIALLLTIDDRIERWMEERAASVKFSILFGRCSATVSWGKVISYSDDRGEHRISRQLIRDGLSVSKAISAALEAAMEFDAAEIATGILPR